MRKKYLLYMQITTLLIILEVVLYHVVDPSTTVFRNSLWEKIAGLAFNPGLLNLIVGLILFRPIQSFLTDKGDESRMITRVQRLRRYSTIWTFCWCVLFVITFVLTEDMPQNSMESGIDHGSNISMFNALVAVFFHFVVFPTFVMHAAMDRFVFTLRTRLHDERGVIFPAGDKRLSRNIFFILIFSTLFPLIMLTTDMLAYDVFSKHPERAIFTATDIAIVLVAVVLSMIALTRKISNSIRPIIQAGKAIRGGGFDTRVPVATDDEFSVLAWSTNHMAEGLAEREAIRDSFGRYMSPEVARHVLENKVHTQGQIRMVTVLFTDIKDYTSISERLTPEQTVELLNSYYTILIEQVEKHGGVVNKFIGDSLMAIFNCPMDDAYHALHALKCAKAILASLKEAKLPGAMKLETRIGINTGKVLAGNIGSRERHEYTIIGDTVNTAQRLEALNKKYGTRILFSESTMEMLPDDVKAFELGTEQLKGKSLPTKIFTIPKK